MASGNTISGTVDVARYIQSGLSNLWYQELCADFEVIVGDKTFRCHKVVLAAVSDYFQAMFTSGMKETVQNQCVLNDIQPEVFESTLELIYDESGKNVRALCQKGTEEIQEYLRIAGMLQMKFLKDICINYFKTNLDIHNCIEVWKIAKTLQMAVLEQYTKIYILSHFTDLVAEEFFLTLDFEDFKTLVEDSYLVVQKEETVFEAVLSWINFDKTREDKLTALLKCCSPSQLDMKYLVEVVSFHPLCRKFDEAFDIIKEAITYKFHKDKHGNLSLSLRACTGLEQIPLLLGERKTKGLKRLLGYSNRQGRWVNLKGPHRGVGKDFACCVYGDSLYITGGKSVASLNLQYNGVNCTWKEKEEMIVPLQKHTMTAQDDHLFIFGGCSLGNINGQVLAYSLEENSWDIVGELIAPVHSASSASLGGKIYIFGGVMNNSPPEDAEIADSVQIFDTKTNTCTLMSHLPNPCRFSRAVCDNKNIFVVTSNGEVIKLKGNKAETEIIAQIPDFNRYNFGAVLRDNALFIYGGVLIGDETRMRKTICSVDVISGRVSSSLSLPVPYEIHGSVLLVVNTKYFNME